VSVHRRGWGSLYAALSKGRIDSEALRDLLASYDLDAMGTPVYAVDVSPWPRCDAEASPGRCYLYHPSRHSAGQPIVAGWGSGERRRQLRVWVCWACGGYGVTRRLKKASLLGTRLRKETAMSEANKALGRRKIGDLQREQP
jgi:DDE superfamily endonuclease